MSDLPPGPKLPSAVQTYLVWTWWDRYLQACRRRYGDVFTVRAAPVGTAIYVADPAAIKEVFTGSPDDLHSGEANEILSPVLGRSSVLVLDGQDHLRRRKLMLPMFHGEAVRAYAGVVEEIAEAEVDRWRAGQELTLHPRLRALTLEVILRAVIGVTDPDRLAALREALPPVVDFADVVTLGFLWPRLEAVGPWKRYRETKRHADALLLEEIRARRAAPDLAERRDVLSLFLMARDEGGAAMTDDELRDQVVTLLLAGHETTATGLAWAFERLVRHPSVMARATAAAHEGDDAYLDAVVQEALRVRPIIFDVVRKLKAPQRIAGHDLPAGVVVAPAIGLVQRDPRLYPEPYAFRPERFLEDGVPAPYTWIPFGGGVRRCLGAAFAQMEMRVVLRTVLRRTRLRAGDAAAERTRVKHITLIPKRGARVIVEEVGATRPEAGRTGAPAPIAA